MSEYQIVPYTFSVHVVGKPGELRTLDDFDAAGTSIIEFIAQAARAHAGEPRREDKTATTAMRIERIARSDRVVALTVGSGQSGIQAEIVQRRLGSIQTTRVLEQDWTHTTVRNVFVVPPGSMKGIALIERVGQTGVVTKLKQMLTSTLRARYHDLTFDMMPAMSAEAIEAWAENSRVKSIVLRHTHTGTGESSMKIGGLPFGRILEFRAPRNQTWSSKVFGGKLDEGTQRRLLTEVVPELPGVTAEEAEALAVEMIEQGWEVSLGLRKDGRSRLVKVSEKASVTMTFPASPDDTSQIRPSHVQFMSACQAALEEMQRDRMSVGDPKMCSWDDVDWDDQSKTWKAVWGVSESDAAGGPP